MTIARLKPGHICNNRVINSDAILILCAVSITAKRYRSCLAAGLIVVMSLVEELDHLVKVRKIVEIVRLGNDDSAQTRL